MDRIFSKGAWNAITSLLQLRPRRNSRGRRSKKPERFHMVVYNPGNHWHGCVVDAVRQIAVCYEGYLHVCEERVSLTWDR